MSAVAAEQPSSGRGSADPCAPDQVLVILPTYNEASTLAEVIERLHGAVPTAAVLVVDDASPDGTGDLAAKLAAADGRISVLHRTGKLGLGTAYVEGFRWAAERGYRYVAQMDSDGSHLPAQLPALLDAVRAGAGLAIGTRWIEGGRVVGWPWYRRWVSRTGTRVARLCLRSRLHDITSGFRVMDASWLERLDLAQITAQGYGFQVEMAWSFERLGCPIAEVPIEFIERRAGRSKMTPGIVFEALGLVLLWGWRQRFSRRGRPG